MDLLSLIISEQFINALGWTIVHSIWEGLLIALLLFFTLSLFKKKSARFKHVMANLALVFTFLTAALTFIFLFEQAEPIVIKQANQTILIYQPIEWMSNNGLEQKNWLAPLVQVVDFVNDNILLIVIAWLIGALVFTARLFGGMAYIYQIKRTATLPNSDHWQEMLRDMITRLGIDRSVLILESSKITMPNTIGFLKPLILFPVGMLNHLTIDQAEAVIAHELAHVYRNDYLLNLIQSIIETVLYFNPGVWWISFIIRKERENSCDDMAMSLCENTLTYAKALVSLQEWEMVKPNLAMGFASNKNLLLKRIKRILKQPQKNSSIMEKVIASCFLCCFVCYFSFGAGPDAKDDTTVETTENIQSTLVELAQDTLPKDRITIALTRNDSSISAQVEDGAINYLIINGEKVPKQELKAYENMVEGLLNDMPSREVYSFFPSLDSIGVSAYYIPDTPEAPEFIFSNEFNAAPNVFIGEFASTRQRKAIVYDEEGKMKVQIYLDEGEELEELEILDENQKLIIMDGDTIIRGYDRIVIEEGHDGFAPMVFTPSGHETNFLYFNGDTLKGMGNNFQFDLDEFKGNLNDFEFYFDREPGIYHFDVDNPEVSFKMLSDTFPFKAWGDSTIEKSIRIERFYADSLRKLAKVQGVRLKEYREAQKLLMDKQRLIQKELAESRRAIIKEKQERQYELKKLQQKVLKQKMEEARAIQKEQRLYNRGFSPRRDSIRFREVERLMDVYPPGSSNIRSLGDQLKKDNLIEDPNNYKFEMVEEGIKIDGKLIEGGKALKSKYISMIERFMGTKVDEDSKITIEKKGEKAFSFSFN